MRNLFIVLAVLGLTGWSFGVGCPGGVTSPEATVPARSKSRVEAKYTRQAFEAGITGTAVVRVKVDDAGIPVQVIFVKWIGKVGEGPAGLDEAAVDAVSQWQFYPKVAFCRTVPSFISLRVVFDFHVYPEQAPAGN